VVRDVRSDVGYICEADGAIQKVRAPLTSGGEQHNNAEKL